MNYQIINTLFKVEGHGLFVNNKPYPLRNATLKTLVFFLESKGKIISKDDLMDYVWEDVIVSDSSVFKQIELIRKLFSYAELPQDSIETIYGKGYKIRYDIVECSGDIQSSTPQSNSTKIQASNNSKSIYIISTVIVLIAVLFIYYNFNSKNTNPFLSPDKRQSIVDLINNDWEEGLVYLNNFLQDNKEHLTNSDFAYLYMKKALAEYHLQDYKNSLETYQSSMDLYEEINDQVPMGQIHLKMATNYSLLPDSEEFYDVQQKHIAAAIDLFEKTNSQEKMIDAQMVLARFYKKYGSIEDAIKLYEKTIIDARNINDSAGAMIANNNLAATYLIINDYDKAIELGKIGLDMSLEIGKGRYIASSYSFLSGLYQQQYRSVEAMDMLEQAIKYQLTINEYSYLSPKIVTLNYLLVQTYQHQKAEELLNLTSQYVQSLKMKSGSSIVALYKGLNAARQYNWKASVKLLTQALNISQKINFKYKQPLNQSYLALAHYFNRNYLRAIEQAMSVIKNDKSDKQAKAIAALALAYSYAFIEKLDLAEKWFIETQNLQNPKWLFEYQLFLKLKLERQQVSNSILIPKTLVEIEEVSKQMLALTKSAQVDAEIFTALKLQINKIIDSKTNEMDNE